MLEKTSARGSHVRGRTVENYRPREVRDGGSDMDSADDDSQRTPGKLDSMDIDEPGSGGRYPKRKLNPFSRLGYLSPTLSTLAQTQTIQSQSTFSFKWMHNSSQTMPLCVQLGFLLTICKDIYVKIRDLPRCTSQI